MTGSFVSVVAAVVVLAAVGFGAPNENVPAPITAAGLLSLDVTLAATDPKPNEGDEEAAALEVAAAIEPNVTAAATGFFSSAAALVVVVAGVVVDTADGSAGLPNEKPPLFGASAGLVDGDPKLYPPLVVVVEVTVSDFFFSSVAGFDPKENPPDATGLDSSFFSVALPLSVASDEAAGSIPKLNPPPAAGLTAGLTGLLPLPTLVLAFSSGLVLLAVEAAAPKLKPLVVCSAELAVELAVAPKENPALGASLLFEL